MSNSRKSAAGRIYYTFGTIFMMAVITVCAMNFMQDSRLMNKPAVAVSVDKTKTATAADGKTTAGKDAGTKKAETKPAGTKRRKLSLPEPNQPEQSQPKQSPSIPVRSRSIF